MDITFSCPSCEALLQTDDQFAGRTMRCPECATPCPVPFPAEADCTDELVHPHRAVEGGEHESVPRPHRRRDGDFEDDGDQRRRPQKRKRKPKKKAFSVGLIALVVGGAFALMAIIATGIFVVVNNQQTTQAKRPTTKGPRRFGRNGGNLFPPKTPNQEKNIAPKEFDPTKFGPIAILDRIKVPPPIRATFLDGTPLLLTLGKPYTEEPDNTLALWNVLTAQKVRILQGDINPFAPNVVFSASGRFVAAENPGKKASTVKIWDLKTGSPMAWNSPGGFIDALDFSPDEKYLIVAAFKIGSRKITFWSLKEQRPNKDLSKFFQRTTEIKISPTGQQIAVTSFDNATNKNSLIKILDLSSQKFVGQLRGHTSTIFHLAFSPDGKQLATGSYDGTIKLWQLTTYKELHSWQHKGSVTAIAFSPDGSLLAAASRDNDKTGRRIIDAHIYATKTKQRLHTFNEAKGAIRWFSWHPSGNRLLTSGNQANAIVWNIPSGS